MHLYQSLFGDASSEYDASKDIIKHIHGHLDFNEISKYYDVDSYSKLGKLNDLHIIHMNTQGLTDSKLQSIIALNKTLKHSLDVICLTETWFTHNNARLHVIPGYNAYHITRDQRAHGGVSVYIKKSIESSQIEKFSFINDQIEVITVEINYNSKKYVICSLYRP